MRSVQLYDLEAKLDFGKYKGKILKEIIDEDQTYLNFCLLKVKFFTLTNTTLNQILKIKPLFRITEIENKERINKLIVKNNYSNYSRREDSNYGYADDIAEFNSWSGNDGYNDSLDSDQQGEDYYNYDTLDDHRRNQKDDEIKEKIDYENYQDENGEKLNIEIISDLSVFSSIAFKEYFNKYGESIVEIDFKNRKLNIRNRQNEILSIIKFSKNINHIFTFDDLMKSEHIIGDKLYSVFVNKASNSNWLWFVEIIDKLEI